MLLGKRNSTGAIYVLQGPPPAGTPFVGGIAVSPDGAIYVSQAFTPPFSRMRIGDSVFVGTQEGIIAQEPIDAGGYYIFEMVSWPAMADGAYDVTLGFN